MRELFEKESMEQNPERLDVVGHWTEMKLQILQEYAVAYAQILKNQRFIKHVAYIDGFAGAGDHISKGSGKIIKGSPARALAIKPRFSQYHFVEMREDRVERLRKMGEDKSVTVYQGDATKCCLKMCFRNVDTKIIAGLCVCLILTS
jgi:three-Cys-motif partner protein